jgi:anti-sigma factor RsiW
MSGCSRFVEMLHARLDGELAAEQARELEAHLDACEACREMAASLESAGEALRGLAFEPMPEADFQAVLDRTVRSSVVPFRPRRARVFAGLGLAAAVIAAALIVPVLVSRSTSSTPSAQEIAQAREDALRALAIAGRALRRAETAGNAVVTREVSPALRHVPLRWDRLAEESRRTRS